MISSRRVLAWTGVLAGLLVFCSFAVHPFGSLEDAKAQINSSASLNPPPEVAAVLRRSCMDCHSNRTIWPWYSHVAPVSWLVERDVRRGRDHLNFSEWNTYNFQEQSRLLADVASAVKNREMPLAQYAWIHHASLSDAETDLVYQWARAERRKLRATLPKREYLPGGISTGQ